MAVEREGWPRAGLGKMLGPRVHDARVAALCLQHGVTELWSLDRDHGRIPELKVQNPLAR